MLAFTKELEPFNKGDAFRNDYMNLTTTDGVLKSYKLNENVRDSFLQTYSQCLDNDKVKETLHVNVVLNSLTSHCLVIDVDYKNSIGNTEVISHDSMKDAELLYNRVVREIVDEMHTSDENTHSFEGFLLTRQGTVNFHLILPYIYMDRHDYSWFIERLRVSFPSIDNVQGWLLHGSVKRTGLTAYQLAVCFCFNKPVNFSYSVEKYNVTLSLTSRYPKQTVPFIFVNLFFPGYNQMKTHFVTRAYYGKTSVEQPLQNHRENQEDARLSKKNANHLFDYRRGKDKNYASVYSVLKSYRLVQNGKDGLTDETNIFEWLKANQNIYEFTNTSSIINTYLFRYFPSKISKQKGEASVSTVQNIQMDVQVDDEVLRLATEFNRFFSFSLEEVKSVIDEYKINYPTVWRNVCESMLQTEDKRHSKQYTIRSILFDLAYQYGEDIVNLNNCCYVPRSILKGLYIVIITEEIERFNDYITQNILPLIPFKICGGEIRLFNWKDRHWQYTMKTGDFFKLLEVSLFDQCLLDSTDEEEKKYMRKVRRKFVEEGKNLQTETVFRNLDYERFDQNPWILGIFGGYTFDIVNLSFRRTIPEDYICRTLILEDVYRHCASPYEEALPSHDIYDMFLDKEKYLASLTNLRNHFESGGLGEDFKLTSDKRMDALFCFLGTVFCTEYDELYFLLSYLADCLIGRNYRRWMLFLKGVTSNGKTTLCKLCEEALQNYCSVFSPEQFYESKMGSSSNGANPELVSKIGSRLLIVEEMGNKVPISVANLNSLTGDNKRYGRNLFQPGEEYNITFQMMCTINAFPKLTITAAVKQRIRILELKSSFLYGQKEYDFERRLFPTCHNMQVNDFAGPFLGLLIKILVTQRRAAGKQNTVGIHTVDLPRSVEETLNTLESMDSPFSVYERTYVLHQNSVYLPVTELMKHIRTYFLRYPVFCGGETVDSMYQTFVSKYEELYRYIEPTNGYDNGSEGFDDITLLSFDNKKPKLLL